jgi:raffinose/stachyose/melibiose transport system permease protein
MMKTSMRRAKTFWIALFLLPTLAVFCLIYMWPLGLAIVSSFTKWNGFEPMKYIGLGNYIAIFKDKDFLNALLNTLKWALFAAFVHVPFGVLVALVLARRRPGWRFTRAVFMIPNIISRASLAILFIFIYKPEVGILNSVIRALGFKDFSINWLYDPRTAFLSVTNIWLWFAAVITLITLAELTSISPSIHEAARIDGASDLQIDWYIHLPLLHRIIGTGVVIAVTSVFKEFDVIYMTTNGGPGSLTMNLAVMMVSKIVNSNLYGYANALGILLLIMGVSVMLLSSRIFRMDKATDD